MEACSINKKYNLVITGHLEGNDQSDRKLVINPSITQKGSRDLNIFVALFLCPFYAILRFQGQKQGNVCLP